MFSRPCACFIVSLLAGWLPHASFAQCELQWDATFGPPGSSHEIFDALVYDEVTGPALYVGGGFSVVGGVSVSRIAKFNGEEWSAVGSGAPDNNILSMVIFDDGDGPALFVCGPFTTIGGIPAQYVAKWNGVTWSALPGGSFDVEPKLLYVSSAPTGEPRLYATGTFNLVGGLPAGGIAVYDGAGWFGLSGVTFFGSAAWPRLLTFNDPSTPGPDLFIAGTRELPGSVFEQGVFRYDGTNLVNIAPGGSNGLGYHDMEAFDDGSGLALYLGGEFSSVAGVFARRIARWNGTAWSEVGGGVSSTIQSFVRDLYVHDDGNSSALYVGGAFENAGPIPARNIARWSGQSWAALADGVAGTGASTPSVRRMTAYDKGEGDGLVVVGNFSQIPMPHIAFWNGVGWDGIGPHNGMGVNFTLGTLSDLTPFDDGKSDPLIVACGDFLHAGPIPANYIAGWDGRGWHTFGPGFNNTVRAATVFDDGSGRGPLLHVGGRFSSLGNFGSSMYRAARWSGTAWEELAGSPLWDIYHLSVIDDGSGPALYAAGSGDTTNVAKWDGSQWIPIGPHLSEIVYSLAWWDDGNGAALHAGGLSSVAGAAGNGIWKWNGTGWTVVGGGLQNGAVFSSVQCLLPWEFEGEPVLAVSGAFLSAGSVVSHFVIFWNGAQWLAVPGAQLDIDGGAVPALAIHDDGTGPALFASGGMIEPDVPFTRGPKKLGSRGWEQLALGLNFPALTLLSHDFEGGSSLYAGGVFDRFYTGTGADQFVRSFGIARWHTCLAPPSMLQSPPEQTAAPGATVTLEAEATGGDLGYRWRRDGMPLNNNAQQNGVNHPRLTLFNVNENDEGLYDVVIQNEAGIETSVPAHLHIGGPCPANIAGGDQAVNVDDLLAVITAWGPCAMPCPPSCKADIVPNCAVNVDDLLTVITGWGPCP